MANVRIDDDDTLDKWLGRDWPEHLSNGAARCLVEACIIIKSRNPQMDYAAILELALKP